MKPLTATAIQKKLEYYCSYQERCHQEVQQKLKSFFLSAEEREHAIVHLIEHNYLNEERFAEVYTLSKLHQKKWGKKRIESELKARNISPYLITKSLQKIDSEAYYKIFEELAHRYWNLSNENEISKKKKKWFESLYRKGFEVELILEFQNRTTETNL